MKNCKKCNLSHNKTGAFCSRSCANSRSWSDEDKRKKSLANRNQVPVNKGISFKVCYYLPCAVCKSMFSSNHIRSYCSKKCNPNMGGYREGSGRAKTGYYKGYYCGSTWELAWVIYNIDHGIKFQRFPKTLIGNGIKYIPDFLQDGKIIEIKGYENSDSVERKTKLAESLGYEVIVLRKEDLKECFQWVKANYVYKCMSDLYE